MNLFDGLFDLEDMIFDDAIVEQEARRLLVSSMPSMDLASGWIIRGYQNEAADGFFDSWTESNSALAVMATGLGKTITAGIVAQRIVKSGKDFLFIAHREELIRQAAKAFRSMYPGIRCGIEMADERIDYNSPPSIVVASKDSLTPERLRRFERDRYGGIMVDEAHHCAEKNRSYMDVLDYFTGYKLGGLTATPKRKDEAILGKVFGSVAYVYSILDGILDGWLVRIRQEVIHVEEIDISNLSTGSSGDLKESEISEIMSQEKPLHVVAQAAIDASYRGSDKPRGQVIVFCPSVTHAGKVAAILNRRNAKEHSGCAAAIDSINMDSNFRNAVVDRFKLGDPIYLCNYGIATEGFDHPGVVAVVIARMTKSESLFAQMIGRGTRPLEEVVAALNKAATAEERRAIIASSRKPDCIARGTAILTDRGLVPIELVTREVRVWDGVEFVSHCGVVSYGNRRVVTYAGLTATLDHKVYVYDEENPEAKNEDGAAFGDCAAEQASICVTGDGGQTIRKADGRYREKWRSRASRAVYGEAEVFDIVNAGPRHRFTAAGLLVSNCLVVDVVGVSGKHKLITPTDILGGKLDDRIVDAVREKMKDGGDVTEAILEAMRAADAAEEERRKNVILNVKLGRRSVDPFDIFHLSSEREPGWLKGKPATDKQKQAMARMGISKERIKVMSRHQATKILHESIERMKKKLCTYAQARRLVQFGFNPNKTFKEASAIMERLRQNGWKRK